MSILADLPELRLVRNHTEHSLVATASTVQTIAVMNWIFAIESLDGGVVETVLNAMEKDRVALE